MTDPWSDNKHCMTKIITLRKRVSKIITEDRMKKRNLQKYYTKNTIFIIPNTNINKVLI